MKKLIQKVMGSPVLFDSGQFLIKLAENDSEVEKALRLRYEVFNLEQGKGLKSAEASGIDRDEFDEFCLHLIVVEKEANAVVGTYRIHLGEVANSSKGFYSAREYTIVGLDKLAPLTIEVGRSCVAKKYRKGSAVALLWAGIAELLRRANLRYLLGCVSLESVDPLDGWGIYESLKLNGDVTDLLAARPQKEFELPHPGQAAVDAYLADTGRRGGKIPPLFKGYLRLGAKICGEPALDEEFGTIDYLIFLDTFTLPERYNKHFNVETGFEDIAPQGGVEST